MIPMPRAVTRPRLAQFVLLVGLLVLLSACGGPRLVTPEERAAGFAFAEFTVRPPPGEDWVLAGRRESAIAFGRRPSETHSVLATAQASSVAQPISSQADLRALMEAKWAAEGRDTRRHRNQQAEARPAAHFGGHCVRYRLQSDDHGAVNRGDAEFLRQLAAGLVCYAPGDPRRVVHVGYSERSLPGEVNPRFEQDAEAFLNGFQLKGAP